MTSLLLPKFWNRTHVNAILLTGIAMTLMYPFVFFGMRFPDLGVLAWLHLVPILFAAAPLDFKKQFRVYFFAYTLGYLGILYWLTVAMMEHGHAHFFQAWGGLFLICCFLAILSASALTLAGWLKSYNRVPNYLVLPCLLVLKDQLIAHLPWGGFPWGVPEYSQGEWLKFLQWVDVSGHHGLGFFIYLVNALLADGLIGLRYRKQVDRFVARMIMVFVLLMVSLFASFLSGRRFENGKREVGTLAVALIQGNIDQSDKWDRLKAPDNLNQHLALTRTAMKNGAEIIFWPETAYPFGLVLETLFDEKFLNLDEMPVPLVFGGVAFSSPQSVDAIKYNGVYYADKTARITQAYFKRHLVPFGEYLPSELSSLAALVTKIFPGFRAVVNEVGDFKPGPSLRLFDHEKFKIGSLICFEDVFAAAARDATLAGADFLVNYSNDAWYEQTSAIYQHAVFSQFRALENRRTVLRVTNTGYTAVIDGKGQIIGEADPFMQRILNHRLKVEVAPSLFTRYGETWLMWVRGVLLAVLGYTVLKKMLGPVRQRPL